MVRHGQACFGFLPATRGEEVSVGDSFLMYEQNKLVCSKAEVAGKVLCLQQFRGKLVLQVKT